MERGRIESLKRNLLRPDAAVIIDNLDEQVRELADKCRNETIEYILENIHNGIIPSMPALVELVIALKDEALYLATKNQLLNRTDVAIRLLKAEFPDSEIENFLVNDLQKYLSSDSIWRREIVSALMDHGSTNCLGALQAIEYEFDPKQKNAQLFTAGMKSTADELYPINSDIGLQNARWGLDIQFGQLLKAAVKSISERNQAPMNDWGISSASKISLTKKSPITELIANGETTYCEFKSTLRWDMREKRLNLIMQQEVIEAIAAFANHLGGTLLIGIDDNGNAIGLQFDYQSFKDPKNRDQLQRHIQDLIKNEINTPFSISNIQINFQVLENKDICRIDILRSTSPIFLKSNDKSGKLIEKFVVRNGNSSRTLSPSEQASYIRDHFGK